MSNKETLFVNKTPAVLPHPPPKMIAGEFQRDHQEEQEKRVLLAEEMATRDNLVHSQEIIPDNEAETYEDKYFHSSHISSLNEPPGNCIKDSEFESGEKVYNKELQHVSKDLSLSENFYLNSFLLSTSTFLQNL